MYKTLVYKASNHCCLARKHLSLGKAASKNKCHLCRPDNHNIVKTSLLTQKKQEKSGYKFMINAVNAFCIHSGFISLVKL